VEHDRETIRAADHVIDLGPGAGARGGCVIASGSPAEVAACAASLTGRYLRGESREPLRAGLRRSPSGEIRLEGVRCHNIEGIDVAFPLGVLTAVTGVSGSGKSSLVMDVLARVLRAALRRAEPPEGLVARRSGLEAVRRLVLVDQRAIGRTPHSTPATYTELWGLVRELYSRLPLSRVRGYGPDRFSFNSPEGRCPACEGQGQRLVDMQFLSDVWITCEQCRGRRFDAATQEVLFRGRSISDVLELDVDQAADLFENQPRILRILKALQDVGLGYIRLGQPSSMLSGGEAQRVKLAAELVDPGGGGVLYILDEPTTGLHYEDVKRLVSIFRRLVDAGNTLVVIEHQLDVIAASDHVIELGPGGGEDGGRIVGEGTPDEIARCEACPTAPFLRDVL
ncbi:MAG: excinuclease ABC subunit UvrA, partial [Planctomycetes bacterium]|nr:excinuclease ABC subunit UvrA [Planctomycetota bacterium]